MITNTPPLDDEVEVSLFGPGFGETVLVHLGDQRWMLVDSCEEVETGSVPTLNYLQELEIDFEKQVELIVVTHWHDDHIRGLSKCVRSCKSAKVCFSAALRNQEFLTLVRDVAERSLLKTSGVTEFHEVLLEFRARPYSSAGAYGGNVVPVTENTRLIGPQDSFSTAAEVWALSPSPSLLLRSLSSVADSMGALAEVGEPRFRVTEPEGNETSVVLWVQVGDTKLLLGGDLEVRSARSGEGWLGILESSGRPSGLAELYKVAHHGSPNGDHERIWEELLSEHPIALVAPFSNGNVVRPAEADVRRICAKSADRAYISGRVGRGRRIRYSPAVERTVREISRSGLHAVEGRMGQIQLRKKVGMDGAQWRVGLREPASRMCEES